jgi:hypothetical protein
MITLIEPGEDNCALCPRDTSKQGCLTKSGGLGEAFLCWPHIKKMAAIEADKAKMEPEEDRTPNYPAMADGR